MSPLHKSLRPQAAPMRTTWEVSGVLPRPVRQSSGPEAVRIDSARGAMAMFRICDTIRRTETGDGGILLDIHHGQMFCLNVIGAKILALLQRGYDEPRIAEEISSDYG